MSLRLVGDIGGTHARFALCGAPDGPDGLPRAERKLVVAEHAGLVEAAQAYLAALPAVERAAVTEAVLAVATPVLGDSVAFTNSPWRFSVAAAKKALGLERLTVINDFVAQAAAVTVLGPQDLVELRPGSAKPGSTKPGGAKPGGAAVVLGPGTGLGVAFVLREPGRPPRILPSEGGHASFSPQDETQDEILRRLRLRHGGHVSVERLLSGPGLLHIALALGEMAGQDLPLREPADVSRRAASGECAICRRALGLFSAMLGAAAGDLALTLLTEGGVFLTGGLCRNLGPLLDREALAAAFLAKGRFDGYLSGIPVWQVVRPHAGLLGAAAYHPPG
ncbi:glucokinase [Teichococcus aestuarii]|uniref:glucokinase n=1 Tax=Teichococcus aestuarii TaxID=568898 RepID=UPI003614C23F